MSSQLYREVILENYKHPQNVGKPNTYSHSQELKNLSCGDEITVYLEISNATVVNIHYEVRGCALTIATASILSEELKGKSVDFLKTLGQEYLENLLGDKLSINRVKCALLPLRSIQQAAEVLPQISSL